MSKNHNHDWVLNRQGKPATPEEYLYYKCRLCGASKIEMIGNGYDEEREGVA